MGLKDLLKKGVGVEVSAAPTEADAQREARDRQIVMIWQWLRQKLDAAALHYLQSGDRSDLQRLCEPHVVELLCAELDRQASAGVQVIQPERMKRTRPDYRIVDVVQDPRSGKTIQFTVEESFDDHVVVLPLDADLQSMQLQEQVIAQAEGSRRSVRVQVNAPSVKVYRINEIRRFGFDG